MDAAPSALIRGARVVDGSGNPWYYADVTIGGDRILEIVPPRQASTDGLAHLIDGTGLVLAPGFIDIQSHSIIPLMRDSQCLSKITQGVTTEIMGEAWTPAPAGGENADPLSWLAEDLDLDGWREQARDWKHFSDWLDAMARRGVSPNIGSFLGGGTLRQYVRGMEMGASSARQLDRMRGLMTEAMQEGAFGVSYALIYPPDAYVDTNELIEVCRPVARSGGIYITHLRSEGARLLEALDESLEIGRRADLPVEIYHLKAAGSHNWSKMPIAIDRIDQARVEGVDVTADMYPYTAAGTGLSSVLSPWLAEGDKFYENLRNPQLRRRAYAEAMQPSGEWEALGTDSGPENIMPLDFDRPEHQKYVGLRLDEIARQRGQSWLDAAIELLIKERQRIFTIFFSMNEDNVKLQLAQPWIKISSDAGGLDPDWALERGPTHPRAYGTYPRMLGKYVREDGLIPLEDAIRKMTSAVANRIGLRDRGLVRAGYYADLVLFDPETVADCATFEDSHRLSTGIRDVWVNGVRVLAGGHHTNARPGRVVHGPGRR